MCDRQNPTLLPHNSIDLTSVHAFHEPEFISLNKLFKKYGFQIRVAGGAVRDVLMHQDPKDVDLATTATPGEMISMFTKENIRILNRNGESHGTVTVRLNDKENFEITTLRIDLKPDGRHSEVSFTTDWQLDASRRDLTVNSMFLDVEFNDDVSVPHFIHGKLYDFFNGFEDVVNRRTRFVGEPAERIKEDYLRILRYFRFHGRLSSKPDQHDDNTLKAISENCHGLQGIAGERIWDELKKIFHCDSAPTLLRYMSEAGVTVYCGLPAEPNHGQLKNVFERGILKHGPNAATCVAAALHTKEDVDSLLQRVHPSNVESNILYFIVEWRNKLASEPDTALSFLKREYLLTTDQAKLRPVFEETLRYLCREDDLERFLNWQVPRFPIKGTEVTERWGVRGKGLRALLQGLRTAWVDSDCTATTEDLLSPTMYEKISAIPTEKLLNETILPAKRRKTCL